MKFHTYCKHFLFTYSNLKEKVLSSNLLLQKNIESNFQFNKVLLAFLYLSQNNIYFQNINYSQITRDL